MDDRGNNEKKENKKFGQRQYTTSLHFLRPVLLYCYLVPSAFASPCDVCCVFFDVWVRRLPLFQMSLPPSTSEFTDQQGWNPTQESAGGVDHHPPHHTVYSSAEGSAPSLWRNSLGDDDGRLTADGATGDPSLSLSTLLIQALQNERYAPEILPFPFALFDRAMKEIDAKRALALQPPSDSALQSLLPFRPADIYRTEIQRVQFLLTDLARLRIKKIQTLCTQIKLHPELYESRLTQNEKVLALRIFELINQAVLNGGLANVPEALQKLVPNPPHAEGEELVPTPVLTKHTVVKILDDVGNVQMPYDTTHEVSKGDIFLGQYETFRSLVLDGRARLV